MIEISCTDTFGFLNAIRGMRNPMESWELSDSPKSESGLNDWIGSKDKKLMMELAKTGPEHAKYRRMITVYCDILAPLYWWKEFDTYKVGTVANSTSTMHGIHKHEFTRDMFSHEHLSPLGLKNLDDMIHVLNMYRELYLKEEKREIIYDESSFYNAKKEYWWQMIQLLPSSYNQKRTIMMNYEILANQYKQRKNHKLDEWRDYCKWIERLPFSWIITGKDDELAVEPNDEEMEPASSVDNWLTAKQVDDICSLDKKPTKNVD